MGLYGERPEHSAAGASYNEEQKKKKAELEKRRRLEAEIGQVIDKKKADASELGKQSWAEMINETADEIDSGRAEKRIEEIRKQIEASGEENPFVQGSGQYDLDASVPKKKAA